MLTEKQSHVGLNSYKLVILINIIKNGTLKVQVEPTAAQFSINLRVQFPRPMITFSETFRTFVWNGGLGGD
jgi:hypothetical protein